LIIPKSI